MLFMYTIVHTYICFSSHTLIMKIATLTTVIVTLLNLISIATSTPIKPHIVFVLVDDWGYADVSYRNAAIYSPNFQMLAKTGLILDRHCVFKYCSPSRASFLTGRWPHHVHQWNLLVNALVGTNINDNATN